MRTHILSACLLAGFAIAIAGAAGWSLSAQTSAEAGEIDFVGVRSEATSALHQLQVAQERRTASLQAEEF
jgi:hypothetical protein